MQQLGSLPIRNTKALLSPEMRICAMIYSRAKKGKTTLAATLDKMTRKHRGKPTLFIASEAAEGGGTLTLAREEYDYVVPSNWNDMENLIARLSTDTTYGGIVLDNASDYVHQIVKPRALAYPCKEKSVGARVDGVPVRSDYQVMGEEARQQLNALINLTTTRTAPQFRKDLIVTALEKEKYSEDGKELIAILPDLPGALADAVPAMFQSVVSIAIKQQVVQLEGGKTERRNIRTLYVNADGVRITDDRTGVFKHGFPLTSASGAPQGLLELWEAFIERIK